MLQASEMTMFLTDGVTGRPLSHFVTALPEGEPSFKIAVGVLVAPEGRRVYNSATKLKSAEFLASHLGRGGILQCKMTERVLKSWFIINFELKFIQFSLLLFCLSIRKLHQNSH